MLYVFYSKRFISKFLFNSVTPGVRPCGSDRQCKGIALGGAGENRAGPKRNDLTDFSGGGLRRAVLTESGPLCVAVRERSGEGRFHWL